MRDVSQVIEQHKHKWERLDGYIGEGEGMTENEDPCILVFVAQQTPELEQAIPKVVEGVPVKIEAMGVPIAFGSGT